MFVFMHVFVCVGTCAFVRMCTWWAVAKAECLSTSLYTDLLKSVPRPVAQWSSKAG